MKSEPLILVLRLARPYFRVLPILVALGIGASLAEGVGIGLIIPVLGSVIGEVSLEDAGIFGTVIDRLTSGIEDQFLLPVIGILILALVTLKTILGVLEAFVSTSVIGRIMSDLRVALHQQFLDVGMAYHVRADQGLLLNTVDTQTYRASEALRALAVLIGSLSTLAVFGCILLLISWEMTLAAVLAAIPVVLIVRWLSTKARRFGDRLVLAHGQMVGRALETLAAMRTIRLFNREKTEAVRFSATVQDVHKAFVRSQVLERSLPSVVELLYLPVFFVVLYLASDSGVGLPTLLAFLVFLYRSQTPLKRIDASRVAIANYAGGVAQVQSLLDRSDKPYVVSGEEPGDAVVDRIRFEHVSFRYENESDDVLQDVSFDIPARATTAVLGPSGSGKSTVMALLCRFYDPKAGRITVDGNDLRNLAIAGWRQRIAFAGQEAELLSGTVRWNIAFGAENPTEESIVAAAQAARAHDFIMEMPDGYDTELGPRGGGLSGGQRQRIALARALLRDPELLILDEATTSVDRQTEQGIFSSALRNLTGNRTVVIVAHQPSVVELADFVVVIQGGKVKEAGTPESLRHPGSALSQLFAAEAGREGAALESPPASNLPSSQASVPSGGNR